MRVICSNVNVLFFDKIQAHIGEVNGTISIGCSSLIGQTLLPEVLSLYNSQFPNVEIQVQVGSTEQIKSASSRLPCDDYTWK